MIPKHQGVRKCFPSIRFGNVARVRYWIVVFETAPRFGRIIVGNFLNTYFLHDLIDLAVGENLLTNSFLGNLHGVPDLAFGSRVNFPGQGLFQTPKRLLFSKCFSVLVIELFSVPHVISRIPSMLIVVLHGTESPNSGIVLEEASLLG